MISGNMLRYIFTNCSVKLRSAELCARESLPRDKSILDDVVKAEEKTRPPEETVDYHDRNCETTGNDNDNNGSFGDVERKMGN